MSKKTGPNSQANLLRAQGVPALGIQEPQIINPIGRVNTNKDKLQLIWTQYDLTQNCSMYKISNLPNGLKSWNIQRMLYYRGSICAFQWGGKLYILPYTIKGNIGINGLPSAIYPITYNGGAPGGRERFFSKDFALDVNLDGDLNEEAGAFIWYDTVPVYASSHAPSRFAFNQIIISELCDVLARIGINVAVSNKKFILVIKDPAQANVVKKELESMLSSEFPYTVLTSALDVQDLQSTNDYNADELFNTVKNWDSIRCFMSGIQSKNFGTEKKERLVSGELAGNEEQIDLVADIRFDLAKEFFDNINKQWGYNITIEKRTDGYKPEENGNGNTKLEEEEQL